jgi:hypothetical protein
MQTDSKQRALRILRRRSVIAGVPIGCLLLSAVYSVSLGLPRLGFSSTQNYFTYGNQNWRQQRIACYWSFSVRDVEPGIDLSGNATPSTLARFAWQLDRDLVWNRAAPKDFLSGYALGIFGPSFVAYKIMTFDNQSPGPINVVAGGGWPIGQMVIPFRPTFALIADLLLCLGLGSAAWYGVGVFRLSRREKAGLCLMCAYPKPGSTCSECGDGAVTTSASSA